MKNGIFLCALVFGTLASRFPVLHGQTSQVPPASTNPQSASPQASTFKLPDPSGTYRIGRVGYEWIDASRPDGYSADPAAHRDLMVYLWYPSSHDAAGQAEPYFAGWKADGCQP